MRPGDFTDLARLYTHRPAYAEPAIDALKAIAIGGCPDACVADIGAGTGKLTAMLAQRGLRGFAVEPNAAMRAEGTALHLADFTWCEGSAEATGLDQACADWVTMASAFHWTDPQKALKEFHRVLKPEGALTLLWNPRDLERDPLQARIEARISKIAPHIERRSSGAPAYTDGLEETLTRGGLFKDVLQIEASHTETMSRERHMGAWRSVNDIRAQAGEAAFEEILRAVEEELDDLSAIEVRYRTRSWTARKV